MATTPINIKVCGMRDSKNISDLINLSPDWIGFIFWKPSKRYVENLDSQVVKAIPSSIRKVGVFVNEECDVILDIVNKYDLDIIQLHGDESPEFCSEIKRLSNKEIWKAIGIGELKDLEKASVYANVVDKFVFDTKSKNYGGTGISFDRSVLKSYSLLTPYLVSGGINLNDCDSIMRNQDKRCVGIDVNSCFETQPGIKDIKRLTELFQKLK